MSERGSVENVIRSIVPIIVAAAVVGAGAARAAEELTLPPAEFKPLPVGTKVKFTDRSFEVTESDGLMTTYKARSEGNRGWLKQSTRRETWLTTYALFGELADDLLVFDSKGDQIIYEIDDDEREKLQSLWPLKVGNAVEYELHEKGGDCTDPDDWKITLKVARAESLVIGDVAYPAFVIEEHGESDSGKIFEGRRWYQPDAGLIIKAEREWVKSFAVEPMSAAFAGIGGGGFGGGAFGSASMMPDMMATCQGYAHKKEPHFGEGEREDFNLVKASFPEGTTTHALAGTKIGGGGEAVVAEVERLKREIAGVQVARKTDAPPPVTVEGMEGVAFGRYHALVIGIDNYKHMPPLKTAVKDANAVADFLKAEYGFKVTVLVDPDRAAIIDKLDELRETLGNGDNLLIYYAGRGWLDEEADRGYWLPVNAKENRRSGWVSNADITDTLKTLQAKHVLVVADSCYSGTLTRAAKADLRSAEYWKRMTDKVARVAITSGGLEPRPGKDGGNSPFAQAFMDALAGNDGILDGSRLFAQLRRPLMVAADQTPRYSDVRNAGHDGGDFLFVRRK